LFEHERTVLINKLRLSFAELGGFYEFNVKAMGVYSDILRNVAVNMVKTDKVINMNRTRGLM
jgi:hypothetical protein